MTHRVLLVEDDDLKARTLQRIIERAGARVERASTLDGALPFLYDRSFAAVVTDWSFPRAAGEPVVESGHIVVELFHHVPVVVVSGRGYAEPGVEWIDALKAFTELPAWLLAHLPKES